MKGEVLLLFLICHISLCWSCLSCLNSLQKVENEKLLRRWSVFGFWVLNNFDVVSSTVSNGKRLDVFLLVS